MLANVTNWDILNIMIHYSCENTKGKPLVVKPFVIHISCQKGLEIPWFKRVLSRLGSPLSSPKLLQSANLTHRGVEEEWPLRSM